ncbi:MAG: PAS domain-containing protein [Desulfovibrio sp.]|jgi:PAS domain S-box-containing protein|nr:PAS domain-containing protein [Desulfovibrio sp.]
MYEKLNDFGLHTVLDTLPCAVFIKGENLRFIYVNRAYEVMFDVKAKEVLGKTVLDLNYLPEEDRTFYQKEDQEMVTRRETRHHIFQYKLPDGKTHTCLYWSGGFIQDDGLRGILGVIVDITQESRIITMLHQKL